MPSTGKYQVNSPTVSTQYNAPSAYWVVPNSGTNISVEVQSFNSGGTLTTVANLTVFVRDVTGGTNLSSTNGGTANTTTNTSGTITSGHVYTVGASVGGSIDHIQMWITSYTGSPYSKIKVRRSGAWSNAVIPSVRRSGAWTTASSTSIRRSGAWTNVA